VEDHRDENYLCYATVVTAVVVIAVITAVVVIAVITAVVVIAVIAAVVVVVVVQANTANKIDINYKGEQ
jgi:hypothetical protein